VVVVVRREAGDHRSEESSVKVPKFHDKDEQHT
jgi:hypothetical protein